jgi:hypothetical protein
VYLSHILPGRERWKAVIVWDAGMLLNLDVLGRAINGGVPREPSDYCLWPESAYDGLVSDFSEPGEPGHPVDQRRSADTTGA